MQRVQPVYRGTLTVFGFPAGSAAVPDAEKPRLREIAEELVDTPGTILRAAGIVDEAGTRALALARAGAVAGELAAAISAKSGVEAKQARWSISVTARDPVPEATAGGRVDVSLIAAS